MVGVASSNLVAPTKFGREIKHLAETSGAFFWPIGTPCVHCPSTRNVFVKRTKWPQWLVFCSSASPLFLAFEARYGLFQISKLFTRENTRFVQARQHLFSACKIVLHEEKFAVVLQRAPVFGINLQRC